MIGGIFGYCWKYQGMELVKKRETGEKNDKGVDDGSIDKDS